ncbi:MAG TPA: PAS domain S-box protein [Vicinamibacteria bacterium]
MSSLPVGILIHGGDCRIEYANKAALEMLGMPEESVCGHTVFEAASLAVREDGLPFPPEDHPGAVALATGRAVQGVVVGFYRAALQDRVWLLVSAQPQAEAGKAVRVVLTLTDLTDRRKAEERQRESEARYRQLIEKAQDIFYRTDIQGRFTYVNPMATRFIGYTDEELLGKHFMELVHPDHRQRVSDALLDQFRRRLRNTYDEFVAVTRDGKALWVGQNVQLLMDGDRVIGFQAAARDVTERKRVEEALEQERRRLQQIVDAAQPRRSRPRAVVAVPTRPRVLVAEDNPINRKVALSMLEHLGYRAEVVVNGLEAVEACARSTYDAILMDCQMPVLDGLRATAWIRQREGRTRRTPIIALTADTLTEDRQRCFAAGMDDFLSKPVTLAVLRGTLERWVQVREEAAPAPEPPVGAPVLPVDHPLRVLESQGRQALVREVLELFLQTTPVRLEALRQMGVAADVGAFLTLCHSLKGAALQLGAAEMADLCTRLEAALRRGDQAEAEAKLGALSEAFERERQRLEPQRMRLHGSAAAS